MTMERCILHEPSALLRVGRSVATGALCLIVGLGTACAQPVLGPAQLSVVVNDADPQSVAVGHYYAARRSIPAGNVIHLRFRADGTTLSASEFIALKDVLDRSTPPAVQAYALTWLKPYRVECMSITSAVAFGFDREYCSDGCRPTRFSPYFNSTAKAPYALFHMRPAMAIAALDTAGARALIDRGIASDGTRPAGTAYLVTTSDSARSVRSAGYAEAKLAVGSRFRIELVDADALQGRPDVMFYFTGSSWVKGLSSNRFLPGAMADHLTSAGGDLLGTGQMTSLRWLEAGATGSYGTVVEPCNFPGKFPVPSLAIQSYLAGETLIEAYWKSVAMPGQGLFIGEPLARPFGPRRLGRGLPAPVTQGR